MSKIILDASAMLSFLNQEPGYQRVEKVLAKSLMSTVNFSEVIAVLDDIGIEANQSAAIMSELIYEIVPFDQKQAIIAGSLKKISKKYGLSLGDRACLALGKIHNLPVYTADKMWAKANLGIDVQLIR